MTLSQTLQQRADENTVRGMTKNYVLMIVIERSNTKI